MRPAHATPPRDPFPGRITRSILLVLVLGSSTESSSSASVFRDREISLDRRSWVWSSVPPGRPALVEDHALLNWYAPYQAVLERDLNPSITMEEGGGNVHPVLELSIRPPAAGSPLDSTSAMDSTDWTGIVQELDPHGLDLSGLQAVEIWVNEFRHDHASTIATLRISLGRFSEDAFWDARNPPNFKLDTEDKNLDGMLDRAGFDDPSFLTHDEDTGLDGLHDQEEPGYTGMGDDPNGDDYRYDARSAPLDYSRINNLERNSIDVPVARPDTEDLNQDGGLDLEESSHGAAIDLSDTTYVHIDVARDFPGVSGDNGWRLFRVPVDAFQAFGAADWARVQAVRLVAEGMGDSLRIQLGGIRLVGVPAPPIGPRIVLHQNRPNPFNPRTTISYELRRTERVRLDIFDVTGKRVATLLDRIQLDGPHIAVWSGLDDSGRRVPSGVYLYRLRTPRAETSRRMVLLK